MKEPSTRMQLLGVLSEAIEGFFLRTELYKIRLASLLVSPPQRTFALHSFPSYDRSIVTFFRVYIHTLCSRSHDFLSGTGTFCPS